MWCNKLCWEPRNAIFAAACVILPRFVARGVPALVWWAALPRVLSPPLSCAGAPRVANRVVAWFGPDLPTPVGGVAYAPSALGRLGVALRPQCRLAVGRGAPPSALGRCLRGVGRPRRGVSLVGRRGVVGHWARLHCLRGHLRRRGLLSPVGCAAHSRHTESVLVHRRRLTGRGGRVPLARINV